MSASNERLHPATGTAIAHSSLSSDRSVLRRRRLRRGAPLATLMLGASLFIAAALPASASQAAVELGTAGSFAVLAGSGITNTGPTTINGDVGTFPTTTQTGFGSVTLNGTNHGGDAVTQGAKDDLVTAYNDAAGRSPAANLPVELGGTTLVAGVYRSPTFGLTGTLTLDAQGNPDAQFIFQAGSTLITASNSQVILVNGADPCHVAWQVGSSATFGTGTQFAGDVLALTSITANTGASFQGRLLARNGAVTMDTNTISRTTCAAVATTTTTTGGPTSTTTGGTTSTTASPTGGSGSGGGSTPAVGAIPGATPRAPSDSPFLPATGMPADALTGMGLALLALGILMLVAERRSRDAHIATPGAHFARTFVR